MTEPPPLSPDVARLLEAERAIDDVSAAEREGVRAALFAAIDAGTTRRPGAAEHPEAPSPGDAPPALAPPALAPPAPAPARAVGRWLADTRLVKGVAGALVLGGMAGFLLGREVFSSGAKSPGPGKYGAPSSSTADSPKHEAPPRPSSVEALGLPPSAPSAITAMTPSDTASGAAGAAPKGTPGAPGRGLAQERTLLERGRSALARGDGAAALAAATEHARSFPSGVLTEEREVLAIRALALEGRAEEARRRSAAFRRRWPSSVFRPTIDALERGDAER